MIQLEGLKALLKQVNYDYDELPAERRQDGTFIRVCRARPTCEFRLTRHTGVEAFERTRSFGNVYTWHQDDTDAMKQLFVQQCRWSILQACVAEYVREVNESRPPEET